MKPPALPTPSRNEASPLVLVVPVEVPTTMAPAGTPLLLSTPIVTSTPGTGWFDASLAVMTTVNNESANVLLIVPPKERVMLVPGIELGVIGLQPSGRPPMPRSPAIIA